MAYLNHDAMSRDVTFQRKLAASLAKNANDIQSEATNTTHHQLRQLLAHRVALDPSGWAQRMAQATIQANTNLKTAADAGGTAGPWTTSDADLDAGVSAVWNIFAGVQT